MGFIELESVGTAVDTDGITHPIFADGTIDNDEGMAVPITECSDEWFWNLSLVEGYQLLQFLDDCGLVLPPDFEDKVESLIGSPDTLVAVA